MGYARLGQSPDLRPLYISLSVAFVLDHSYIYYHIFISLSRTVAMDVPYKYAVTALRHVTSLSASLYYHQRHALTPLSLLLSLAYSLR